MEDTATYITFVSLRRIPWQRASRDCNASTDLRYWAGVWVDVPAAHSEVLAMMLVVGFEIRGEAKAAEQYYNGGCCEIDLGPCDAIS